LNGYPIIIEPNIYISILAIEIYKSTYSNFRLTLEWLLSDKTHYNIYFSDGNQEIYISISTPLLPTRA